MNHRRSAALLTAGFVAGVPVAPFVPLVTLVVVHCALPSTLAQTSNMDIVVQKGAAAAIPIAVPDAAAEAALRDLAAEIVQIVRDDLAFSRYFTIVDPTTYRLVPPSTSPDEVPHAQWLDIGADTLATLALRASGDRLDVEARLFQNQGGSLLLARRYGGTREMVRRVAHQISDDIVLQRTGQRGIALTRIAFVSKHGDGKEVYLMDYDGMRVRRLTTSGTLNLSPVWSPAGNELAFVSWRGRQPGVYVMNSEGVLGHLSTIGGELSTSPDWSPDGNKLVYTSDAPGNTEIYVLDRRTGKNTRLTHSPSIDTAPAFSPNGREIAFTSDRTGSPQIYLMDAEGLNVRRLSWDAPYNDAPAWSPDGSKLAYVARIDGRFDIAVLDLGANTTTRLTRGEGHNENPAWSPDGRHLVFASSRGGGYDLYTMGADGSSPRRLTRGGANFTPHWSP